MKWLFRPPSLMILGVGLILGTAYWVYESTRTPGRPVPPPLIEGDCEIAWLNTATSAASWQRFVSAVTEVTGVEPGPETFPRLTTAVPEIAIPLDEDRKLRFRWYKTTSEWDTAYWMQALVTQRKPPLAIVGGSTTANAIEQARELRDVCESLPEADRPLLLLTTATADRVVLDRGRSRDRENAISLMNLHKERTFRFCFSNRQMAATVTDFIGSRDELRPDTFPVYVAVWGDDDYSSDLVDGFLSALTPLQTRNAFAAALSDWGLLAGYAADPLRQFPLLTSYNAHAGQNLLPYPCLIPWSVGSYERPNPYESQVAEEILDHLLKQPLQRRPLLILSGQSRPSRRLVRALQRLSPTQARSFVLATGDALPFNSVYRDCDTAWHIQDLSSPLIFFCHHNPVADERFWQGDPTVSGTEDLLLFKDIVASLVEACGRRGNSRTAGQLGERLHELSIVDGVPQLGGDGARLFDSEGNRCGGTGEHVVWLQPQFSGPRVLPEAVLTIHAWRPGTWPWQQVGAPLRVQYNSRAPSMTPSD